MWRGNFKGAKGYKVYKLSTSNPIAGIMPAARFSSEGVFMFVYRTNCSDPDRKVLTEGLREILNFKGRCLLVTDFFGREGNKKASAATIEFYCRLPEIPSEEKMITLENYLSKGDF